ncbi:hypothetical protein GCM10010116_25400 [Microbispora rosea subsp. aerata]|nr:hypothetical protein GCM10010116_25400 [Microbispora rosea subsp. aerata]GIH54102.1 hypothetical protein Mro02_10160 [Microbispora rosea subsp. aerata]GLJ85075.1 hypothetical protein GCM10017588_38030 [Microbispora rosea subsp. aerata]
MSGHSGSPSRAAAIRRRGGGRVTRMRRGDEATRPDRLTAGSTDRSGPDTGVRAPVRWRPE